MSHFQTVTTDKAPGAIGPYSQAVKANNLLFCSGQIPLDPQSMEVISGGITEQSERVLQNLGAVLEASGSDFSKVLKATCYLKNMDDFAAFNEVYAKYFGATKPARACVQAAKLPKDVLVEVDLIAVL